MASGTWISWQSERSAKETKYSAYFTKVSLFLSALAKVGCKPPAEQQVNRARLKPVRALLRAYAVPRTVHWRKQLSSEISLWMTRFLPS